MSGDEFKKCSPITFRASMSMLMCPYKTALFSVFQGLRYIARGCAETVFFKAHTDCS